MEFIRWDPFKDLVSIHERLNKLFEDTLASSRRLETEILPTSWTPPVDIYETDKEIILEMELPGMSQDDIQVEVRDNLLILRGERHKTGQREIRNYHRQERSYGLFQRCFRLPKEIKSDQLKARYQDGVLEVIIPKAPVVSNAKVIIDIRVE